VRRAACILGCALGIAACFDEAPSLSTDVATADLSIYVVGQADDERTSLVITASGPEASGGSVRFVEGDRLSVISGTIELRPARQSNAYEVSLPHSASGWSLVLERDLDEDATAALPVPPRSNPVVPPSFSRADGVEVRWTPSDDAVGPVVLQLRGPCIPTITRSLSPDPGVFRFLPADLGAGEASCDVELVLSRVRAAIDESTPLRFVQYDLRSDELRVLRADP
jgi:hypothetical protein